MKRVVGQNMNFIKLHTEIISLFFDFISFIILGIIAFLTLKFTAKPKLKISLEGHEKIQGQEKQERPAKI